jgi:hypothetical protein
MIATSDVLAAISSNPWTALVFSADGQITEVVPLSGELSADTFLEFTRTRARGRRFRLVQKSELTETQLGAIVSEATGPPPEKAPESAAPFSRSEAVEYKDWGLAVPLALLRPLARARAIADAIASWFSK